MILIDTSAWIEHFNGRGTPAAERVRRALDDEQVIVGDLVMVELLQGVRFDKEVARILVDIKALRRESLCGAAIGLLAAANYRGLRRRGITIRSTIDVIIATWCIENGAAIIHNDRDMAVMEAQLGLRAYA
ncbi:type II toxin-antitoxin system VapC family toxin [Antarcticirhabdus aurantiaca]|uniref:PIN domain-containing protein n=1 Tax=Antarcticirhabdus aurantiaca TaxID=2606717 RepID=A0ACD4NUI7_9HYPH|nr:PIN domain-containing protein [Antarcticirhabdus aurantiaca]WAJ30452.1 PIN domain-containing protein [Jeongeuplla avenae]